MDELCQASLGVPPTHPGPFFRVYREWSKSGHSRNIKSLAEVLLHHYGEVDTLENPYPSTIQALAKLLSNKAAVATLEDRQCHDTNTHCVEARSLENNYQEAALGMLLEGPGVDALHVRGANSLRQQELQDACAILAQSPRSTNLHFCPVVPDGHSPRPLVSSAITADREDNSANLAAGPTVPQVNCTTPTNVANGVHTPFLCPLNVQCIAAGGAAGGGAAVPLCSQQSPSGSSWFSGCCQQLGSKQAVPAAHCECCSGGCWR